MTEHLFEAIGGKGKIVRFFHSAHPGVRQREIALDDALKANARGHRGGRPLRPGAGPGRGQPRGDGCDPARQSRRRRHRRRLGGVGRAGHRRRARARGGAAASGIVIAGIDGNPQAIELIKGCTPFIATVRQGFGEMARIAAEQLDKVFAGGKPEADEMYAPVELITRESLGVTCPD